MVGVEASQLGRGLLSFVTGRKGGRECSSEGIVLDSLRGW